jgi:hypothetical protein
LESICGRCQAVLICILFFFHIGCEEKSLKTIDLEQQQIPLNLQPSKVLVPTFLGNDKRKFHGIGPVPHPLTVLWKLKIGGDSTRIGKKAVKWYGTGWTGQPSLVCEEGHEYLMIGGYDHALRKIDAENGKEIWKYTFDDVIKASSTLLEMKQDIMILQGSRQGFKNNLRDMLIPSFRAISFNTG